ncbi:MAG TPA: bifunctional UDP-sugar hydrolase/5'-nucleotidase [Chthonomonadales bacterium]|nr:bifunctional UDP-sugar hydrolase/5'-nucleotidase [Chthonomonadales bacterium]
MRCLGRLLQPLLAVAILLVGLEAHAPPTRIYLTILHTNDTHGRLLPFSYPEVFDPGSDIARLTHRRDIGGIARRATVARQVRAERRRHTVLVDSGDICDGTPFSTEYNGDADVAAMSAAGYDVACLGNHELNNTIAQVRRLVSAARYPTVCANLVERSTGRPVMKRYVIRRFGPVRVAFFGLLTTDARKYSAAREGLIVTSPVETARGLTPALRKQADVVIALTHLGISEDRALARAVPGIDVIVGGHSHTLLAQPLLVPQRGGPAGSVRGTIIAHNHQWGGTLGRLDLTLVKGPGGRWIIQRYSGRLLPITSSTRPDPAVQRVVDRWWRPIAPKYGRVVGTALGDFARKGQDRAEYNLMADAMRAATGADFHMENLGGVRSHLAKGPITHGDLVTMDPFDNTLVRFRASGAWVARTLASRRPAVSGIRYVVDGARLVSAEIGGARLDESRIYTGSTNSYYARSLLWGVDGVEDTGQGRLAALMAYVESARVVRPSYDGRRVVRHVGREEE